MTNKKAFSLIELVLVIVVTGIAIPGIVLTFYELSRKSYNDETVVTATMLAEGELERIVQKGFAAAATGEPTSSSPASFDDSINSIPGTDPLQYGFHGYSWYLVAYYVDGDSASANALDTEVVGPTEYKRLEVRVTNNLLPSGSFVALKTIVTNN
jgi:type II secretory pathway pseudopilin PulG